MYNHSEVISNRLKNVKDHQTFEVGKYMKNKKPINILRRQLASGWLLTWLDYSDGLHWTTIVLHCPY